MTRFLSAGKERVAAHSSRESPGRGAIFSPALQMPLSWVLMEPSSFQKVRCPSALLLLGAALGRLLTVLVPGGPVSDLGPVIEQIALYLLLAAAEFLNKPLTTSSWI